MKNFYIVLTDKEAGWDKIVGRRVTTIDDINGQAKWIWSLLRPSEKLRYRVLVQGALDDGDMPFDSEKTIC